MKKLRKQDYLILCFLAIIFAISFINIFYDFINQILLCVITVILLLLSHLVIGVQKDKSVIEKDIILTIIAFILGFNIVIYLLGLFTGFTKSIYSLQLRTLLNNVGPIIVYTVLIERLRYVLLKKCGTKKFFIILLIIAFIFIDNTILLADLFNSDNLGIMVYIQQFGLFIVPSIITNIFLTYQTSKVGYKSSIIYRLLMELPLYIIPIYPNFGDYILSVIRITIPTGGIIYLYRYLAKLSREKIIVKKNIMAIPAKILVFGICFILVYFVCGKFRYQAYVIASGSMIPNINIGDVVIVDKKYEKKLEIGDVIAFKSENKIFCHRINNLIKSGDTVLYETKGDNNKDVDQLLVKTDQIVGLTKFKIRYIGYPTVWLINSK